MTEPRFEHPPEEAAISYLADGHSLRSWFLTTDHKRIALLYLVSITFFFLIGASAAALIRLDLLTPQADLLTNEGYNRAFSIHGIVMVWFFLIPAIPNVLGNFLVPIMIGARDLAFPRLNLLSWYIYIFSGLLTLYVVVSGGVDTGWTFYTPLSSAYANGAVVATIVAVFISGFSTILTGINFIVTIHKLRAPGMTWGRLPLFIWSHYATSIIFVLATPVLAVTLLLVAAERLIGIGVFDPRLGGDPLLFQHLFWFYSHPAVYIMILPALGVISELITAAAHKRIFGYWFVAIASIAIAVIGFMVWGHHMFVSGQSVYASAVFSFLSIAVAVPSAIKVYNWTATLYKADIAIDAPLLFALSFIGLFVAGGLTGLMLAMLAIDVHVTDTYFVVAHFHYIMVGGSVTAFFGGLHFWWPKITGRLYNETLGRIAAVLILVGFNVTFFPQFLLGYEGMPRRYHVYPPEFQVLHVISSMGAALLAVGYALPAIYLIASLLPGGRRAPANPWGATGLEWTTSSPPPKDNFTEQPVVARQPYDYPLAHPASRDDG
ncbi:cytochrome c oxidase subunit 1 [Novosphingobium sp. PhB165]|uniref:cytochrome c oxidase subunit I n=1 Tax=Novosphingobium sp. PhB165 TaxID=2485105 RepID=UPI0010492135|nr:cbb3-type cytochrome c oxidase subunit I [Novosphingobium sp. PhB165]TCM14378.1 cytochrome c oxidase subunit 1 [Novosphingobium sp. PhB165]